MRRGDPTTSEARQLACYLERRAAVSGSLHDLKAAILLHWLAAMLETARP